MSPRWAAAAGAEGLTDVRLDRQVSLWFREKALEAPWLVDVGEVVAVAFHPWTFRIAVVVACVAAWREGRRRAAVVVGVTMAVGGLLGVGLKLLIARPRPFWGDPVAVEIGYAMPSGHALNAALGLGLLLLLGRSWLATRGRRVSAGVVAGVVLAVTVLDRLVLGVHYLTDVTVGVLLGAALTAVAARLLRAGSADRASTRAG